MKKFKYLSALLLVAAMSLTALSQVENPYMIKNINTTLNSKGIENGSITNGFAIVEMNGTLYFNASSNSNTFWGGLWKTQGHPDEATLIFEAGGAYYYGVYSNNIYFSGKVGNKYYIFKSNGTTAGTASLKALSGYEQYNAFFEKSVIYNDNIYFVLSCFTQSANGSLISDYQLWKTNGTAKGTVSVKNISKDNDMVERKSFALLGNKIMFFANDGKNGLELWRSDGTSTGTVMVKNINPTQGEGSWVWDSPNFNFPGTTYPYWTQNTCLVAGGFYYFIANDGSSGIQVWKSDATANGTVRVTNRENFYPHNMIQWGNDIYFSGKDSEGWQWWKFTIGNEAATLNKLTSFNPDNPDEGGFPCYPTIVGDWMYFSAMDATYGRELFKMNQSGYIELVCDIYPGTGSSKPNGIPNSNYGRYSMLERDGIIYFTAFDENNYHNIYSYDTQNNQLQQLTYFQILYPNYFSSPRFLTLVGNKLIFSFDDLEKGLEPWAYDLTWGQPRLGDNIDVVEYGENNILIYPNPAQDNLYISAELNEKSAIEISLTDVLGNQIQSINKPGTTVLNEQLNISNLAQGVYFIRLKLNSSIIIRKIVKN